MHVPESCNAFTASKDWKKKRNNRKVQTQPKQNRPLGLLPVWRLVVFKITRAFTRVWLAIPPSRLLARRAVVVATTASTFPENHVGTQQEPIDTACHNLSSCKREGAIPLRRVLSRPLKSPTSSSGTQVPLLAGFVSKERVGGTVS